jgi:hypothetical protein
VAATELGIAEVVGTAGRRHGAVITDLLSETEEALLEACDAGWTGQGRLHSAMEFILE